MPQGLIKVRDYLRGKGFKNEEIGWDPETGTVLLRNQPLLKPTQLIENRSYSPQAEIDKALAGLGLANNYRTQTSNILQQLISRTTQPFTYDPSKDPAYQAALQQAKRATQKASKQTMEELNLRNILNSTITRDALARIAQERYGEVTSSILPQLMGQAYQRQQGEISNLYNLANLLSRLEETEYGRNLQQEQMRMQQEQMRIQQEQQAVENAWNRVQQLGYVDNVASQVLGVPVGTPSWQARNAAEQRRAQMQLQQMSIDASMRELERRLEAQQAQTGTTAEMTEEELRQQAINLAIKAYDPTTQEPEDLMKLADQIYAYLVNAVNRGVNLDELFEESSADEELREYLK